MTITVRQMTAAEADLIIDYFHGASREHLEKLGVDPTRLSRRDAWRRRINEEFSLAPERRRCRQSCDWQEMLFFP